jgi:hypothetical protein
MSRWLWGLSAMLGVSAPQVALADCSAYPVFHEGFRAAYAHTDGAGNPLAKTTLTTSSVKVSESGHAAQLSVESQSVFVGAAPVAPDGQAIGNIHTTSASWNCGKNGV